MKPETKKFLLKVIQNIPDIANDYGRARNGKNKLDSTFDLGVNVGEYNIVDLILLKEGEHPDKDKQKNYDNLPKFYFEKGKYFDKGE